MKLGIVIALLLAGMNALATPGGIVEGADAKRLFDSLQGEDVVETPYVDGDSRAHRVRRNGVMECRESYSYNRFLGPARDEWSKDGVVYPEQPTYSCHILVPTDPCRDKSFQYERQCG